MGIPSLATGAQRFPDVNICCTSIHLKLNRTSSVSCWPSANDYNDCDMLKSVYAGCGSAAPCSPRHKFVNAPACARACGRKPSQRSIQLTPMDACQRNMQALALSAVLSNPSPNVALPAFVKNWACKLCYYMLPQRMGVPCTVEAGACCTAAGIAPPNPLLATHTSSVGMLICVIAFCQPTAQNKQSKNAMCNIGRAKCRICLGGANFLMFVHCMLVSCMVVTSQ